MDFVKSVVTRILVYNPENGVREQASEFYAFMVACFVLLLLLRKLVQRPRCKLLPSQPSLPILGHLHLLGTLPHQSMAHLARKYGEIYSLRLGSVPAIVVTTPAMAREFLQTHYKIWASRSVNNKAAYYFSYDYSGVALAPYTPAWLHLRKLCTLDQLFTRRRMEASQGAREEEMWYMIRLDLDR